METWRIVKEHGNPKKTGVYDVILIYDEEAVKPDAKATHGFYGSDDYYLTGRTFAFRSSRYFGNAFGRDGWIMKDQPETGLVWLQQSGSFPTERVYAWLPPRNYPDIELPSSTPPSSRSSRLVSGQLS